MSKEIDCIHDLTERETAVTADGYCPLCMAKRIAELEVQLKDAEDDVHRLYDEKMEHWKRAEQAEAELSATKRFWEMDLEKLQKAEASKKRLIEGIQRHEQHEFDPNREIYEQSDEWNSELYVLAEKEEGKG